jgi:long-chain acyl-CoA synthetase
MHTYDQLSFSEIIPDVVSKYANHKALGYVDEEPMTYSQMGQKINAVIAYLESLDVKPGDKVIIYSQNMPNWGIVYFALQCMSVVAVPVLPDFNTNELQNILNHCEAKVIFVSESLEYKLAELNKDLVKFIVRIDNFKLLSGNSSSTFIENACSETKYESNENGLSILLYTSGTTGASKGVMLSQKNVILNAYQANEIQPILEKDRFLSILPLSHTYENTLGLILPIIKGGGVTYLRKPPTAPILLPAMKSVKPHLMMTVPLIIEKVYKNSILPEINKNTATRLMYKFRPTQKLVNRLAGKKLYETFGGNLKFFGIGGAKLDPHVEQFLRDAKFPFAIGYGLTETAPLLAGSAPGKGRFQAIGPKVVNCDVIVNNPDPKTGEGEIWAKGDNIMLGYYKNEKETKEVLTDDGWFKTGDLGTYDKKGYLSHKGRLKNMIVGANGENIYPEEIESLINKFKHVIESVVVEQKGKLVALVHFNREEMELKFKEMTSDISKKIDETISELKLELHNYINSKVNKTSKIQKVVSHPEPFKKTATQKIKRYLYKPESIKNKD